MSRKSIDGKEIVLAVYNAEDAEGASLALLKADIAFARRKIGAGKYGNFLLALNNYGEEIYVAPGDMERARQVLDEWRMQKKLQQKQDSTERTELTAEEIAQEKKVLWARILAGIALAVVVVFYILQRY